MLKKLWESFWWAGENGIVQYSFCILSTWGLFYNLKIICVVWRLGSHLEAAKFAFLCSVHLSKLILIIPMKVIRRIKRARDVLTLFFSYI